MNGVRFVSVFAAVLTVASGCDGGGSMVDGGTTPGIDATTPGVDGSRPPGIDGSPPGIDAGCVPAVEICGDRMDQNCDGRDQSCGDNDGDGWQACRAGDDLTRCDCDDSRTDVYPPAGPGVPGAPEICDGRDNDCNGRVDESAACCAACVALGDAARGDVCTPSGACDCSTAAGEGPCPSGQTCCAAGCTDIRTDVMNCGYCNTQCTQSADRCTAGNCACGTGPVCDLDFRCTGGSCGG